MWQYTDSLQELTTSVNRILTNDKTHQVEEATSFFTMFNFPVQNEEDLISVNEYLNDEKNFNVAVIFYKCVILKYVTFFITVLHNIRTLLINEISVQYITFILNFTDE